MSIDVPRDRDGSFAPVIVKKRQRRDGDGQHRVVVDGEKAHVGRGLGPPGGDLRGVGVEETISRITDRIVDVMVEWQNRTVQKAPQWLPPSTNGSSQCA